MSIQRPIVRVMGDVAQATSDNILEQIQAAELAIRQQTQPAATDSNIICINYLFGTFKEIVDTMQEYEKSPESRFKKYPLIALILPISETRGSGTFYSETDGLQIIIAIRTEPTLKAGQRYTKSFEPILLPIYEELMEQIAASSAFVAPNGNGIKHRKTDHPGAVKVSDSNGLVFPDFIDAVEVSNLRITNNFNNC